MKVRFWGTRGSLPVAQTAAGVREKVAQALLAASGRRFSGIEDARRFASAELDFATGGTFGGATTCVEMESGDGSFLVCDMGSGFREFGIDAARRIAAGHAKTFHIFLSHLHWDHIMGFPFFGHAFDPEARIVIHAGHEDAEVAMRRQQEEISFPVAFDWLKASIEFHRMVPGEVYDIAGCQVETIGQNHSYGSFGYRFTRDGKAAVFSTDSEHKIDDMEAERAVIRFFGGADLVICDTMYSLADSVTMKEDWGHSSNIVAVDLCHAADAKRLALFHHEPTFSDADIQRMHEETIRYEELTRGDTPLEVLCAYDGLEVQL
ncbi:MBL fold metallo-hydrolase [Allosphingosinicella indica]|uniref:Phosphoribosyl 1,2-cyclic phosphodiesterase n=1 Tax=Allosphingosinicella indica TaxID=941907 RepID=A0A1X7GIC5_9SPHN|nr:MBL fold metallo-hydrolase [Allosphingosinicella indica]SMF70204.1 Phosphoribosyl 1,2-cyclic phosphodiesterase [Allosphingosinicella indica]